MLLLLLFQIAHTARSRHEAPALGSTLITSAPHSARRSPAMLPAGPSEISRMRRLESAVSMLSRPILTGSFMSESAFHRRIRIVAHPNEVRAAVEDDFHHFRVVIAHEGGRITSAGGEALRFPFTSCPMAGSELAALKGKPLSDVSSQIGLYVDARHQCTHMFDLAGLAMAVAARGLKNRSYHAMVPDRVDGQTQACLWRDGMLVLEWDVHGDIIGSPPPFVDIALTIGFTNWAAKHLDREVAEAALILRRAVATSGGRGMDLDSRVHPRPNAACFTNQPQRAAHSFRVVGSTRDFASRNQELTAADTSWLELQAGIDADEHISNS